MKDPKVNKEIVKYLVEAKLKIQYAINVPNKYSNLPTGSLDKIVNCHIEINNIIREANNFRNI